MTDTTTDPTLTPVLSWQRWKRGGGMYANAPGCGQAYSYVRLPASLHTDAGTYQLTDFHWRHGRTAVVASAAAARELAEQWFAAGPPDDGFARLRAAWGDWHDNVPDGKVGVYVMLPDGSDDSRLIDHDTYLAAMTDDERRIPVGELGDPFDEDATTKAV